MTLRRVWMTLATAAAMVVAIPSAASATLDGTPADPAATPLSGPPPIEVVAAFDATAGQTPEGIVMDRRGVIYTSFALSGEIRRIRPDGVQDTVAVIDTGGGLVLGLTIERDTGEILAAVKGGGGDPHATGVWRVSPGGGATQWVATDPAGQPNGIFADHHGHTYLGDSLLGVVWRIDPDGELDQWAADPLLEGDPDAGVPIAFGANGVLVHQSAVYVANTDRASVVRIPVRHDGSAGTPHVYVSHPELLGADDMAFDAVGNLYVTTDGLGSSLVKVTPWRQVRTIATLADGIDYPAQLTFGRGAHDARTLYIANVGLIAGGAAVLAVHTPWPGSPS
jgi:sugar lactone lactonase YvrE